MTPGVEVLHDVCYTLTGWLFHFVKEKGKDVYLSLKTSLYFNEAFRWKNI